MMKRQPQTALVFFVSTLLFMSACSSEFVENSTYAPSKDWTRVESLPQPKHGFSAAAHNDAEELAFLGTYDYGLARFNSDSNSWQYWLSEGIPKGKPGERGMANSNVSGISGIVINPLNKSHIIASVDNKGLFYSKDAGNTFHNLNVLKANQSDVEKYGLSGFTHHVTYDMFSKTLAYATRKAVFYSYDFGHSWSLKFYDESAEIKVLTGFFGSQLVIDELNENFVLDLEPTYVTSAEKLPKPAGLGKTSGTHLSYGNTTLLNVFVNENEAAFQCFDDNLSLAWQFRQTLKKADRLFYYVSGSRMDNGTYYVAVDNGQITKVDCNEHKTSSLGTWKSKGAIGFMDGISLLTDGKMAGKNYLFFSTSKGFGVDLFGAIEPGLWYREL